MHMFRSMKCVFYWHAMRHIFCVCVMQDSDCINQRVQESLCISFENSLLLKPSKLPPCALGDTVYQAVSEYYKKTQNTWHILLNGLAQLAQLHSNVFL